jgi:hypothetical protein
MWDIVTEICPDADDAIEIGKCCKLRSLMRGHRDADPSHWKFVAIKYFAEDSGYFCRNQSRAAAVSAFEVERCRYMAKL